MLGIENLVHHYSSQSAKKSGKKSTKYKQKVFSNGFLEPVRIKVLSLLEKLKKSLQIRLEYHNRKDLDLSKLVFSQGELDCVNLAESSIIQRRITKLAAESWANTCHAFLGVIESRIDKIKC